MLKCDLVIDPDNAEAAEEMKVVCDYFIEQCKPRDFHPRSPGNEIIVSEKAHENMVLTMQEAGIKTDNMTVYDLYSRIEYFEKKYEKVKQHERNKPV